ncbi:MAG: nucleotidyl transferase AbiEii/AbiGii toxin family protein [Coriobacteriia bacterium]|nr:nucleotidyl transferase AbiEii/AbiGii toxin family protein [Coriobacteriia bacterium]
MKLHNDRDAFLAILQQVNQSSGIRADILEKDYYVTLLLKELADKQGKLPAYFKGGTALYKALGTIQRFSEDIDLTVRIDDCSNTQAKRRLERAAQGYLSLTRTENKALEHNRKGSISCAYDYEPITGYVPDDALQRFGHVRIEATSFTVSEPTGPAEIAPVLYTQATDEQKGILDLQYDVAPFLIETINIERIFVDKIFAAEFYYERQEYFDVAKHIYDIAVMSQLDVIQDLLVDAKHLNKMIAYKRQEEGLRIGSDLVDKPFSEFTILSGLVVNADLSRAYSRMQEIYVFDDAYRIEHLLAYSTFSRVLQAAIDHLEG